MARLSDFESCKPTSSVHCATKTPRLNGRRSNSRDIAASPGLRQVSTETCDIVRLNLRSPSPITNSCLRSATETHAAARLEVLIGVTINVTSLRFQNPVITLGFDIRKSTETPAAIPSEVTINITNSHDIGCTNSVMAVRLQWRTCSAGLEPRSPVLISMALRL